MNVADLLREAASRDGGKVALHHGATTPEGSLTYAELDARADRVASGLAGLGIAPGDRVAIAMHNTPEWVQTYFGILRAGAVVVPLNAMLTEDEVKVILADSGARALIGAPPFGEVAARAARSLQIDHVLADGTWSGSDGPPPEAARAGDDLAVLPYTSGTTGVPKGAMLSHANLLANLEQQMAIPDLKVTGDDVLLMVLPLFHIFGLNVPLGLMVLNGATGVLLERFEPEACLQAIQEHGVTILFGAPPMYVAWARMPEPDRYDLSSVRLAVSGAAPLDVEVLERFSDAFGVTIYEGYGMTETAPTLTSNRVTGETRPGSVGRPLPGVELRLVDELGQDVEAGDPGEVIVRGPNVFQGYWEKEEETANAFLDGWFRTGDIAVEDDDGYLYLVDRKRDLIIVSGFNVYPSEVENALLDVPGVAEAAVVGVPHEYMGEAVKAYVVLSSDAELNESELMAELRPRLARFKRPESIVIVDELPHLLTGKVLRRALR